MDKLSEVILSISTCFCLELIFIFPSWYLSIYPCLCTFGRSTLYFIRFLPCQSHMHLLPCWWYFLWNVWLFTYHILLWLSFQYSWWIKSPTEKHYHLTLVCLDLNIVIPLVFSISVNLNLLSTMFCNFFSFFHEFLTRFNVQHCNQFIISLLWNLWILFLRSLKRSQQYNCNESYLEI